MSEPRQHPGDEPEGPPQILVFEGRDIDPPSARPPAEPAQVSLDLDLPFKAAKEQVVERFEIAYLTELCRWARGNVAKAARKADIDRMYAHRLFQRYGLKGRSALD